MTRGGLALGPDAQETPQRRLSDGGHLRREDVERKGTLVATSFNAVQRRVLGVLIEKTLSQAGSDGLTLHSIMIGCNQKTNREPVVEYAEGDVARTVRELMDMQLVAQAPPEPGARVNRFGQRVEERLGWGRREQAVMAELLVRGPQTVGELRGRIGRMNVNLDVPGVQAIVDELGSTQTPPLVVLPREPGRSAVRYRHTMGAADPSPEASRGLQSARTAIDDSPAPPASEPPGDNLPDRLGQVEATVRRLDDEVEMLKRKLAALEGRTPQDRGII
ncbi:MAG: DUF480 domain-containing protein [Planctomycetes bacterium]|nr:DUF480 domain-containing protein [Planctomycetota bacterium]